MIIGAIDRFDEMVRSEKWNESTVTRYQTGDNEFQSKETKVGRVVG